MKDDKRNNLSNIFQSTTDFEHSEGKTLIKREPSASRVAARFSGFRRTSRVKVEMPVVVRDNEGLEVPLESLDLSLTGVFLKSSILFDVGQIHTLEFPNPYGKNLLLEARVVRVEGAVSDLRRRSTSSRQTAGMGYEFVKPDEVTRNQLRTLIGH